MCRTADRLRRTPDKRPRRTRSDRAGRARRAAAGDRDRRARSRARARRTARDCRSRRAADSGPLGRSHSRAARDSSGVGKAAIGGEGQVSGVPNRPHDPQVPLEDAVCELPFRVRPRLVLEPGSDPTEVDEGRRGDRHLAQQHPAQPARATNGTARSAQVVHRVGKPGPSSCPPVRPGGAHAHGRRSPQGVGHRPREARWTSRGSPP